jgi:hypothetical protein
MIPSGYAQLFMLIDFKLGRVESFEFAWWDHVYNKAATGQPGAAEKPAAELAQTQGVISGVTSIAKGFVSASAKYAFNDFLSNSKITDAARFLCEIHR